MPEPIKTTVQEAFDHIKAWIAEGSKDKAIQGLNEILNFDPTNAEAQKLLLEVKTSGVATPAVTPVATPITAPAVVPAITSTAPATTTAPAIPVVAPPPVPSPAPVMPPPPMPPIMPPKATSVATPLVQPMAGTAQTASGIMSHLKLIIAIGGVIVSIVAGYIFYKNVLSDVGVATDELKSVQDAAQEIGKQVEAIPSTETPPVADATTPTPESAATDSTTAPSPDAPATTSDADVVEATTGKVKRRE